MGSFIKRIVLFIALNAAILITVSLLLSLFQVQPYLSSHGLDYSQLLAFCLIWGMAGSFLSLALSRLMAKWMMGVEVIDPDTTHPTEKQLVQLVKMLAQRAGLPRIPEVGIYESEDVNAFAVGPTRARALVAVSTALLRRMDWKEIEGVVGHEVAHISNGDMVTLALLQGVVNAFVMFFARVLAFAVSNLGRRSEERSSSRLYPLLVFVFECVFMILGSMILAAFSRRREFRADEGGARYTSTSSMVKALNKLQQVSDERYAPHSSFQAFCISGRRSWLSLFATHPPLEERIARLEGHRPSSL